MIVHATPPPPHLVRWGDASPSSPRCLRPCQWITRLESIVEVDESVVVVEEDVDEDAVVIRKASKVDRMTTVRRLISRLSLRIIAHHPFRFSSKKSSELNTTDHGGMDSIPRQDDDQGKDEEVIEQGKMTCQDSVVIGKAHIVSRYRAVRCIKRFTSHLKKMLNIIIIHINILNGLAIIFQSPCRATYYNFDII